MDQVDHSTKSYTHTRKTQGYEYLYLHITANQCKFNSLSTVHYSYDYERYTFLWYVSLKKRENMVIVFKS